MIIINNNDNNNNNGNDYDNNNNNKVFFIFVYYSITSKADEQKASLQYQVYSPNDFFEILQPHSIDTPLLQMNICYLR
jgi:hypothetical protein